MCGARSRLSTIFKWVRSGWSATGGAWGKRGEQGRRESLTSWAHADEMDDRHKTHHLSHGECARDVTLCWQTRRRNGTMRTHTQVFVLSMWKSVIMVMSSLVSASCSVTTQSWPILNFPLLVPISTCSQFQRVVRLYELIVTFPCSHFLHTCTAKTCHLRCCAYTSRRLQ